MLHCPHCNFHITREELDKHTISFLVNLQAQITSVISDKLKEKIPQETIIRLKQNVSNQ